jgi:hypothetical protein
MATQAKKVPQDHKPKKGTPQEVTVDGITVKLDVDRIRDDFEIIMAVEEIQEGNGIRAATVFKKVLGEETKRVLEALRDPETGVVSSERAGDFILSLLQEASPNS